MTTIVYKNGVMAADSRAYGFGSTPVGKKDKIIRLSDGRLLGVSSSKIGLPAAVAKWVEEGMKQDKVPVVRITEDFDALLVSEDGVALLIDGNWLPSSPIVEQYYAIGSGASFALAALYLGCSAPEAVAVACEFDVWSAQPISIKTHKQTTEGKA